MVSIFLHSTYMSVKSENILSLITSFEGKRDRALTFIIPSANYHKNFQKVFTTISNIKDEVKKNQLTKIINVVFEKFGYGLRAKAQNGLRKVGTIGIIVCCGLSKKGQLSYYELIPKKPVSVFEYHYGYVFHMDRIMTFMYDHIVPWKNTFSKIDSLWKYINALMIDDKILYENDLTEYLDSNVLKVLYVFTDINTIPKKIVGVAAHNNVKIILCPKPNKDFSIKPETKMIGQLKKYVNRSLLNL